MGDKGILLTLTRSGGIQLPSPGNSVFVYVTSESTSSYSVYGQVGGSSYKLMDTQSISSPELVIGVSIYSKGVLLSSAATVNDTVIASDGNMFVGYGGLAVDTTVTIDGKLEVGKGGVASNVTLQNGDLTVYSGGSAVNVDHLLWEHNDITIHNGGYISYTSEYTGIYMVDSGTLVEHIQQADSKAVVRDTSMYVARDGVANYVTVDSGRLHIKSGGLVNNTSLSSNSYVLVSYGGTISSAAGEGITYVLFGGTAYNINTSSINLLSGGVVNNITGSQYHFSIQDGAVANSVVFPDRADDYVHIEDGGIINYASIEPGGSVDFSRGIWNSALLASAVFYAVDGCICNHFTCSRGGKFYIYPGVKANDTIISSGGFCRVVSNAVASGVTICSGGKLDVESGGSALRVSALAGGTAGMGVGGYIEYV